MQPPENFSKYSPCSLLKGTEYSSNHPALPSKQYVALSLCNVHLRENTINTDQVYKHFHRKITSLKLLTAISRMMVSYEKCRQIMYNMIVDNPSIFHWGGLALNHMTIVPGRILPGKKTWRNYSSYRWNGRDYKMCLAGSADWAGKRYPRDDRPLDLILFGRVVEMKAKNCCQPSLPGCMLHSESEVWEESCGMSKMDWTVARYATMLLEGLRQLMKAVVVDDDRGSDNVLEIFRKACAKAVAEQTYPEVVTTVRFYTTCILDPILSAASYYQLAHAHECNNCDTCKLIFQSHINLFKRGTVREQQFFEAMLSEPHLFRRKEMMELLSDAESQFKNFKASLHRPRSQLLVSSLKVEPKSVVCGDERDILKAALYLRCFKLLSNVEQLPYISFLGTVSHDALSKASKCHANHHRYPLTSNKTKKLINQAFQLVGNVELTTLRVQGEILVYALNRKYTDSAPFHPPATNLVADGNDMISLLTSVQIQGGSKVYGQTNLCAFSGLQFTGNQTLWLPPLAEDLLQAGVYVSESDTDNTLAVFNVVEQPKRLANMYSIRKQSKASIVEKARHTGLDIYHCSHEGGILTAIRAKGVRVGATLTS